MSGFSGRKPAAVPAPAARAQRGEGPAFPTRHPGGLSQEDRAGGRFWRFCGSGAALSLLLSSAVLAEEVAPAPRPVVSEIVAEASAALRSSVGVVEAQSQTVLAFQTLGRLAERPVQAGDRVAAGERLARLDQVTLAEDQAAAEAALTSAEVQVKTAEAGLVRAQELRSRGVVPEARLEAARRARDAAAAGLEAARADLSRARDAAGFADLLAPEAGIVLSVLAEPGQVVTAGQPVLAFARGEARDAVIDLPAAEAAALPEGAAFLLEQPGGGPAVTGTLRLVEPVSSSTTRSRRVRIALPEGVAGFRIGSLVHARRAMEGAPLLTLPEVAVFGSPPQVWLVAPEGRAVSALPVTVDGSAGPGRVVITSGLNVGQEIVVRGVHGLKAGTVVGERVQ